MSNEIGVLTRAQAKERLWSTDDDRARADRVRNYELESKLGAQFGGEWVIGEWCPFNGIFCKWAEYAPEVDASEAEADIRRAGEVDRAVNVDYCVGFLRSKAGARAANADAARRGIDRQQRVDFQRQALEAMGGMSVIKCLETLACLAPEPGTGPAGRIDIRYQHAARTAIKLIEGQLWRPMEEAPKDGTRILVWDHAVQRVAISWWAEYPGGHTFGWRGDLVGNPGPWMSMPKGPG